MHMSGSAGAEQHSGVLRCVLCCKEELGDLLTVEHSYPTHMQGLQAASKCPTCSRLQYAAAV